MEIVKLCRRLVLNKNEIRIINDIIHIFICKYIYVYI